jgi:DNA phosphorothioation-dependent restriction protein DptG
MSSWSTAGDWLTVAGSSLLVFGTWAQAWASLTEYRDLFKDMPQAARAALEVSKASRITILRSRRVAVVTPAAMAFITEIPRQLEQIREAHGEVAARAAQLMRLTAVWSVLAVGAVLILLAAVIQLVLAYA